MPTLSGRRTSVNRWPLYRDVELRSTAEDAEGTQRYAEE